MLLLAPGAVLHMRTFASLIDIGSVFVHPSFSRTIFTFTTVSK